MISRPPGTHPAAYVNCYYRRRCCVYAYRAYENRVLRGRTRVRSRLFGAAAKERATFAKYRHGPRAAPERSRKGRGPFKSRPAAAPKLTGAAAYFNF